jgi:hypothetical protein
MMEGTLDAGIEARIGEWRAYLLRRGTMHGVDVDELEDHLRSQMAELGAVGLSGDEAFLVAIKRIGGIHELSREFARERSSRLWKQLVLGGEGAQERSASDYRGILVAVGIAIGAAVAFKLPALFGVNPFDAGSTPSEESFYLRNAALLALPFLVGYLAWTRRLRRKVIAGLAAPFAAATLAMNGYPFDGGGDTEALAALHLVIVLWLTAGVAYLGGAWWSGAPRMDFVRFTGEWFIYYTLIALGGGVLSAMTIGVFEAIDIDMAPFVQAWVLPCGAVGAVLVVAWLVEAKQSVVENMAPVLTAVFTPLFALMLVAALIGMAATGNVIDAERDVLIMLDVLLILVTGLVLYAISARGADAKPTLMDWVQLVLVGAALAIDIVALAAIAGRIEEFGWTPNRTAGLGLNVVLLGNLVWSAWLLAGFVGGRRRFAELERWQTQYIPVYAAWAAFVVLAFPPLFGFE